MTKHIQKIIGTAFYDTHGAICEELINAGYDLDNYYSATGLKWGDFSKVYIQVSLIRGAQSYNDYVDFFHSVKQEGDTIASKQLFARVSGIYTPRNNSNQTIRTRNYRQRQFNELQLLRESTALKWIDENLDDAVKYIKIKQSL